MGFAGDLMVVGSAGGGASLGMRGLSSLLYHCRQSNIACPDAAEAVVCPTRPAHLFHVLLPPQSSQPEPKLVSGPDAEEHGKVIAHP